jgi:probable HAF family extracellular repeat protein
MKVRTMLVLASVGLAAPAMAGPGSLVSIGDLPGGPVTSEAFGVSPDGLIVVGSSAVTGTNQFHAVAWTRDGGLVDLGLKSGGTMRTGYAVTNDGVVSGETTTPVAAKATLAGASITILPGTVPNGFFGSAGLAISADGARVAGSRELSGFVIEACYWDGTTVQSIGNLSSFPFLALAQGISADGSVIVGQSDTDDGYEGFRWTSGGGMVALGVLPGASTANSNANAISRDGAVIVGSSSNSTGGTRAVKWVGGSISELPGQTGFGDALATNLDGSVVAGRAVVGSPTSEAAIWDASGLRSLAAALTGKGVDTTGWTLKAAYSMSEDGRTIVGTGVDPSGNTVGYVAYLGTACVADINNDGNVDLVDFFEFLNAFDQTQLPAGDTNYDLTIDLADFFEFFNAFDSNC